jgi:prefoldin alpha subunit
MSLTSNKKLSEEDIKRMAVQHQQMQYQAEAIAQQINMVEISIADSEKAINTLTELEGVDEGHDILIPIGLGANIRANLTRTDNVIIEIGAGISVEKKLVEAKQSLTTRKTELTKYHQNIKNSFDELVKKMKEIEAVVSSVAGQQQTQQKPVQSS